MIRCDIFNSAINLLNACATWAAYIMFASLIIVGDAAPIPVRFFEQRSKCMSLKNLFIIFEKRIMPNTNVPLNNFRPCVHYQHSF